jgi:parallel beta-helix repeat protein
MTHSSPGQRRILALLFSALAGLPCEGASESASAAPAATLYVSQRGSDGWSGTLAEPNASGTDGPLATVGAARDRLRQTRPRDGARVLIRAGTYHLNEPLRFTSEDSGSAVAPRIYEAFPGERVTIAGTRTLDHRWQSLGADLHVLDLGVELRSSDSFRTLFVDGARATWARYPNEGFLLATGGQGKTAIALAAGTARQSWSADPAAKLNIVAEHGWYNEIVGIKRVSEAGDLIELTGRELVGRILPGNRFYIQGVRTELDAEGEWYLDRPAAKLYYYSKGSPATHRIEAAVVDRLIDVRGTVEQPVRHLAFRGLEFFGSDFTLEHVAVRTSQDAAIHLVNARDVEVTGCRFVAVGGYAVWLHLDSQDNVIRGNEVVDGGAGGVLMTGARFSYLSDADLYDASPGVQEVAPIGNVIAENHIHRGGLVREYCSGVHLDSRPMALSGARGNYVGFNHIHDMPRNGVFIFRNQGGNIIEANHIHDVLKRTNDGGAIHLASMNPLSAPTQIVDNRIYRVGYQGGDTKVRLAFGIYPDWFTSHLTIRGNIVSDTRDGGIRLLGGSDTVIEDNVIGDDPAASVVFGSWMTNSVNGLVLRGNVIVNGQGEWVRYYTGGNGPPIDQVAQRPSEYWVSTHNTYWSRGTGGGIAIARSQRDALRPGDRKFGLAEIQQAGAERGSVEHEGGANGPIDIAENPERFGLGADTLQRMQHPRSTEDAKAWLHRLTRAAVFVAYDDDRRVTRSEDWRPEPTKINEFLSFADLKQAASRTPGGTIAFSADLAPGRYEVYLQWYGDSADRAPRLDVELAAHGVTLQKLTIDHHQEAHKWIRVGMMEVRTAGSVIVRAINPGGGMTAINAVAWLKANAP